MIRFKVLTSIGKDGRLMNPETKGSARAFVIGGHAVITNDNPRNKAWAKTVSWVAKENRAPDSPWAGPISIGLVFGMRRPAHMPKGRTMPDVRPDLDKMVRSVKDALTNILYLDDAQIVSLVARKEYAEQPGVYVELQKVGHD